MRKILDGFRFDTETATPIGSAENLGRGADNKTDQQWWVATLYRTPRGARYFLAGIGGPMTRFAQGEGVNTWSEGSGIIPLSDDDAFDWAQRWLSTEDIEAAFADRIEKA